MGQTNHSNNEKNLRRKKKRKNEGQKPTFKQKHTDKTERSRGFKAQKWLKEQTENLR